MTSYDKGGFVADRPITIEPCADGSFLVMRATGEFGMARSFSAETVAFSSAHDMLRWLTEEYQANMPQPPLDVDEPPSLDPSTKGVCAWPKCTCAALTGGCTPPQA